MVNTWPPGAMKMAGVIRVPDLGKARVQHSAHHGDRVPGPQLKPGAQPGLAGSGASAVNSMLRFPPPRNLTTSIGSVIPG